MTNDFKTLLEFLQLVGSEATGRELESPTGDAAAKLLRFGTGQCAEAEQAEVCEMLRMHPAWMRWVADRVKMARANKGERDESDPDAGLAG